MIRKNKNDKNLCFSIKRIFDVIISLISLIVLFPIFTILGVLIKLDSKGPIFFIQERVGKNSKIFKMYKFRTMIINSEKVGLGYSVKKDDSRITKVGKYLRLTGIDELPQILNVLKGEMSLVGPRPTLLYQVKKYSYWEKRRLEMRPGITSLMIISGHNKLSWPEKIKTDIYYIGHWSLWLDLKILFRTVWVIIFTREGIYEDNPKADLPEKNE
jgi:lipopolysaccharide/colanic/teichoic acid biosynthesis glycosyltransferase